MEMNVAFKLSVIIALFVINSSQEEIKYGEFKPFETGNAAIGFPFGSIVGLYCVQGTNKGIEVFNNDNTANKIVKNSTLQQEFSNTYQFQVINATTALFKIKNLTTQINGSTFICQNPKLLLATVVGFNPINDVNPLCSSSYGSRFIFEDSVKNDIEMICTSEEGDPPVMMSTYIRDGDEINDVTSISTRTVSSYPHPSKTLSFSSYFNSSFNNSVFVCNVSQQLPAPYPSYQGSCFFGPILFLPFFSVAVTPPRVMFSDVKITIFNCTSNVSEVNLTWSNIPNHWIYNINEGVTYIELNVTDTGSDVGSADIQCVGNYRNKNITSTIRIRATNNPGRVIAVLLVVMVICFCLICLIVPMVYKYRLTVSAGENSSTSNANDRNTSNNDGIVPPIESQIDNSNALNLPSDNYTNINSSLFTYDSGGYLSPCEPLQEYEQYDIVN
ncbi:uncharacterized protein [Apostichopus japonicus]|uniref:uncharacterized protein n=1 Tax=Stichopus japonicus TaxID=307972 RepID=UPI003AB6E3A2